MKKNTTKKQAVTTGAVTIGIDLGDRVSHVCMLDAEGTEVETGTVRTTMADFERKFAAMESCRIAIEVGSHSRWVEEVLTSLGHDVVVANARKVRAIYTNESKCDKVDAAMLAKLARVDPSLLHPVQHRSSKAQRGLALVRGRAAVVRARTLLINALRGMVKTTGTRLTSCSSDAFASKVELPQGLAELKPMVGQVGALTGVIHGFDKQLEIQADELAPAARKLTAIYGVGLLTAVTFVLTIDDPKRFEASRMVGAYLGMRPRRDQSGRTDKALGISKTGDPYLRTLLVQCAHRVLAAGSPDSELRDWGLKLAGHGSSSKKRAVVAVARKLAVLMHTLWVTERAYDPHYWGKHGNRKVKGKNTKELNTMEQAA